MPTDQTQTIPKFPVDVTDIFTGTEFKEVNEVAWIPLMSEAQLKIQIKQESASSWPRQVN